jgi:IclR family pca regulon transcriptional regulator
LEEKNSQYFSKPFAKGLRVLDLFTPDRSNLSLTEIAEALETNKSSAFRFVNTLVELEYLKKDPKTKLLTLGSKAYSLGMKLAKSFSTVQIIKPILDETYESLQVTIDSALIEGISLLNLYRREVKDTLMINFPPVETAIHCTALGKAILAFLPTTKRDEILDQLALIKRTKYSLSKKSDLVEELGKIRKKGYATNNEEYTAGLLAIAAPFFSLETNNPVGAVSFDFSTLQLTMESAERMYAKHLLKLAKDISKEL